MKKWKGDIPEVSGDSREVWSRPRRVRLELDSRDRLATTRN